MIDIERNLKIIEDRFGLNHKISGDEVAYCCPFCLKRRGKGDSDYKFSVNIKSLKGHCFKCNVKLRLTDELVDVSNSEVFTDIFNFFKDENEETEDDEENLFYVPDVNIIPGTMAYKYCMDRGITEDKINYYNLKFGTGEYLGRIIIPNDYNNGWTDMFQARSYTGTVPKYRNPFGVDKSKIVFNINRIKENAERMYICEGAITAICAGKEAVGVYGCHPSDIQIQQIIDKHCKEYICTLDNDEAGRPGNEELAKVLSKKCKDSKVYICFMPEGVDAADIGETKYKEYVEKNKIPYLGKLDKLFY